MTATGSPALQLNKAAAIDLADQEIPRRFYENTDLVAFGSILITAPLVYLQEKYLPVGSPLEHIGATALYCSAVAADHSSTIRTFNVRDAIAEQGLNIEIHEKNPLYDKADTVEKFKQASKGSRVVRANIIQLGLASAVPTIGVAFSAFRFAATLGNRRKTQRIEHIASSVLQ